MRHLTQPIYSRSPPPDSHRDPIVTPDRHTLLSNAFFGRRSRVTRSTSKKPRKGCCDIPLSVRTITTIYLTRHFSLCSGQPDLDRLTQGLKREQRGHFVAARLLLYQPANTHRRTVFLQDFVLGFLAPPHTVQLNLTHITMNAPISSPTTTSQQASFASTRHPSTDMIKPPPPRQTHTPSTDPFLRDFTLVAEAAKRAQMAVLVRDLENIGF